MHQFKHTSNAFEERHQKMLAEPGEGADPEDPNENRLKHIQGRVYEQALNTLRR